MKARLLFGTVLLISGSLLGCENMPGRPAPEPEVPRPENITSFKVLYQQNCAGCHGANGQMGSATNLSNPEYEAIVDDATLHDILAKGQPGTLMPGFGKSSGCFLTDGQIDILVHGLRASWSKGNILAGLNAPPYKAEKPGDTTHGQQVYTSVCAQCHGAPGGPPGKAGSILDGSFLALISDQTIRTTVITGRPDLGMPDWRSLVKGQPLSNQDVDDVVAWVIAQRPKLPGQPYPQTDTSPSQQQDRGAK
jgi:cytochrome c oxidase cbb3-type subunit III